MKLDKIEMNALQEIERALGEKIVFDARDLDEPPRLQKTHTFNAKNGHVEKLMLKREVTWQQKAANPNLTNAITIPDALGHLKYLKTLLIWINLTKLPDTIGNLTELQNFAISVSNDKEKNMIQVLPDSVGNWYNLEEFKLYGLRIRSLPESVGNWKKLKRCYIESTFLTDLPLSAQNWVNLEEILLDRNHMTSIPAVVCAWPHLKLFRMMECPIQDDLHGYILAVQASRDPYNSIVGEGITITKSISHAKLLQLLPDDAQIKALSFPAQNIPFAELRQMFIRIFGSKYIDYECVTDDEIDQVLSQSNNLSLISKFNQNILLSYCALLTDRYEYNQARTVAQVIKKLNPNLNANSLKENLNFMFINTQDFDSEMEKSVKTNKEQFKEFEKLALLAFSKRRVGKFNEAIPQYQYLSQKLIGSAHYDIYLAHIYNRLGNKGEALRIFNLVKQKIWNFNHDYPMTLVDNLIASLK